MNKLNNNLGALISLGLDLDLFFSMNITDYDFSLIGFYTVKVEDHLISKGFTQGNYIYNDNPEWVEYKKDDCRIALHKK
jgi:hypothetical protein